MKSREKQWRISIGGCVDAVAVDPDKKDQALRLLARAAEEKKTVYVPGRLALWRMQFSCLAGRTIAEQILFLLFIPVVEQFLSRYTRIQGWEIFPALSVWMALGSLILVQELSGHFSTHMAELEQSCYLNLSQLWLMRMISISGLDVLVVLVIGGVRSRAHGFGWFSFAVYVLTPFFAVNALMLLVLSIARGKKTISAMAAAFLAGAGFSLQLGLPRIYEKAWLPVWMIVLAASAGLCIWQIGFMCKKMEGRGEELCWN